MLSLLTSLGRRYCCILLLQIRPEGKVLLSQTASTTHHPQTLGAGQDLAIGNTMTTTKDSALKTTLEWQKRCQIKNSPSSDTQGRVWSNHRWLLGRTPGSILQTPRAQGTERCQVEVPGHAPTAPNLCNRSKSAVREHLAKPTAAKVAAHFLPTTVKKNVTLMKHQEWRKRRLGLGERVKLTGSPLLIFQCLKFRPQASLQHISPKLGRRRTYLTHQRQVYWSPSLSTVLTRFFFPVMNSNP